MPRPPKRRSVGFIPQVTYFKPRGIPVAEIDEVQLGIDELEAIRLKDYLGLDQNECANRMKLAQSTFQRLLMSARIKVSSAIIEGRALRIEGGNYQFVDYWLCNSCNYQWETPLLQDEELIQECPSCKSNQVQNQRPGRRGWRSPHRAGHGKGRRRGRI